MQNKNNNKQTQVTSTDEIRNKKQNKTNNKHTSTHNTFHERNGEDEG